MDCCGEHAVSPQEAKELRAPRGAAGARSRARANRAAAAAEARGAVAPPPGLEAMEVGTLAPPPGLMDDEVAELPAGSLAPPGLCWGAAEDDAACELAAPTFQVALRGLPNKILSEPMMEAVLQQAGLEGVLLFSTEAGKPCGEALVSFTSREAAEKCAAHFHGCQWDPSGREVTAEVILPEGEEPLQDDGTCGAAEYIMEACAAGSECEWAAAMEAFCYLQAAAWTGAEEAAWGPTLSAEAPCFVPFGPAAGAAAAPAAARGSGKERSGAGAAAAREKRQGLASDVSTEVGESEAEDEGETPKLAVAAS